MKEGAGTLAPIDAIEVKGTPVHALIAYLDERLTGEQKLRVITAAGPVAGDLLRRRSILQVETFPVSALNRLTEAAANELRIPVEIFARDVGRAAADEAVRGIWRLAAAMLTPTSLLEKGGRLWQTVYSQGKVEVDRRGPGEAVITLKDFPCEAVCCARIGGWFERLFEMARAKNIKVAQTECYAHGAPFCRWTITWS